MNEHDYENNPRLIAVEAMVHVDPHISLHKIQRHLGVPKSTARRYLRNVKYYPYHITLNQALSAADYQKSHFLPMGNPANQQR